MQQCCLENKYKWIYTEQKQVSPELVKASGSRIVAQLLLNRGIDTPDKIKSFLDLDGIEFSSPYLFEDMEKAVNRINKAIETQEHIVIYGDFDADGVTSTSLLYKTLKHLNANVSYFIPDRSEEGHGLNSASVCRLISSKKAKLIITVDCGVSNLSEITLAKGLGTDIIITDHHEAPEILPPAYAIINPKLFDDETDLKYLAGVGVAYKLACALLESNDKLEYSNHILCLVAVGTIADVVPLLGENRGLVHKGLKILSREKAPGLIRLLEVAGCNLEHDVSASMIAFGVAPRINAIGRLGDAGVAVELLTSDDPEEIETITKKLNNNNKIRQQMCETTFIEASLKVENEYDLDNNKAIILADSNWHPGIIGIVASKLVEKYYRPVFLISLDSENNKARCSARSIKGLNLYDTLLNNSELFSVFGGHALAAGFTADLSQIKIEEIIQKINLTVNSSIDIRLLEPSLQIDMDINPNDLTIDLVEELNKLAPFGECNPFPVFTLSNLTLKQYKTMGSANNHLKLFLSDDEDNQFEAVWWQKNGLDIECLEKVNIAFAPDINSFAGKTRIQLVTKDIQLASQSMPPVKSKKITTSLPAKSEIKTKSNVETEEKEFEILPANEILIPKWVDHRKKTDIEKSFTGYFKLKDSVAIYAEDSDTLKKINENLTLKTKVINRLNINRVDELFLFDLPPDYNVFSYILEKSCARVIHLVGKNYNGTDPGKLIKTLSGMLKYAHSNKNGEININQIASLLYTTNDVVLSCINLLNKVRVIDIKQESDELVKFEFIGSIDLSTITGLDEYKSFIKTIKNSEEFRYKLATLDTESIQSLIHKP